MNHNANGVKYMIRSTELAVDGGICIACGHSHRPSRRLGLLKRLVRDDVDPEVIQASYPCLWPDDEAGQSLLHHDMARVRKAVRK